jgi:hypothetical protein
VAPTSQEIDKQIDRYIMLMETEIGEDIIPITMIMMCRIIVKYQLDINWVLQTIMMGYHNEAIPDLPIDMPVVKFDS